MTRKRRRETRERIVGRDAARRLNRVVETLQEESREHRRSNPGTVFRKVSGPGSETVDQPGGEPAAIRGETGGPKYPDVRVSLVGEDGNAFSILGRVSRALREGGAPRADVEAFMSEATSGDYDALLRTVLRWVEVE